MLNGDECQSQHEGKVGKFGDLLTALQLGGRTLGGDELGMFVLHVRRGILQAGKSIIEVAEVSYKRKNPDRGATGVICFRYVSDTKDSLFKC
jgi:hypothetical protein